MRRSYKNLYQQQKKITQAYFQLVVLFFVLIMTLILSIIAKNSQKLVIPVPEFDVRVQAYETEVVVEKQIPIENMDSWVGKYVDKYFTLNQQRSEARMIMHCLLHRESGHQAYDENGPHGDGGKAGGILQFHQPTWERMRNQMIKAGYITEVGSRYDVEAAIETTIWALKNGRGREWGPIYRSIKGTNKSTCPVPSWD